MIKVEHFANNVFQVVRYTEGTNLSCTVKVIEGENQVVYYGDRVVLYYGCLIECEAYIRLIKEEYL